MLVLGGGFWIFEYFFETAEHPPVEADWRERARFDYLRLVEGLFQDEIRRLRKELQDFECRLIRCKNWTMTGKKTHHEKRSAQLAGANLFED